MNFYKSAALALDYLDKHQGSVKGSLAAAGVTASGNDAKRVLALVIETLKYKSTLQTLLATVPLQSLEKLTFPRKTPPRTPSSGSLLLVLLHDLLFTPRGIQASDNWEPKAAVKKHQARLKGELVKLQLKAGVARKEDLAKSASGGGESVRYIRWNPNVDLHRSEDWSLPSLQKHLATLGYNRREAAYPVPPKSWFFDPHLPDCLLVFPGGDDRWKADPWYLSGAIILQDKASCMPAKVLMEGWTSGDCLDATAAPGNKTSYISALMGDQGKLYAFEKSHGRYKTLEKMLATANCKNVKARRADFTESDPHDDEFKDVKRLLLDPSCSGSGIVNRLDYLLENAEADEPEAQATRLEKLAGFQLQMILHAFKFPAAERIVYSTCSIHAEEDEQVVMRALASKEAKSAGWSLAPRSEVLPKWHRRGREEEMGGNKALADGVIRCLPEDHTNGFFVACFMRNVAPGEQKSKKRKQRIEDSVADAGEEELEGEDAEAGKVQAKAKTQAQLDRAKRKKAAQKKRKVESTGSEGHVA